jgi:hypothetical protein
LPRPVQTVDPFENFDAETVGERQECGDGQDQYYNAVSKLVINTESDIIEHRIPNSFQHIEEDTEGVAESNKFEDIDKEQPSTSATPSPPRQSRTRAKLKELLWKQNAYQRPR